MQNLAIMKYQHTIKKSKCEPAYEHLSPGKSEFCLYLMWYFEGRLLCHHAKGARSWHPLNSVLKYDNLCLFKIRRN